METKANYVLIGAATVAGIVLVMLFAMWMTNSEYRRGFNEYEIVFDAVRGLNEGGEVRFNGIKVGEVRSLTNERVNESYRVVARVRVSRDVELKTDSYAQLEPIGLTGVTLIQLYPGSPSAEALRPAFGAPPPRIPGRGSQIDILIEQSEDIALRASEAMAAVRDLLTDDNIARVTRIVENLETVSARLADRRSVINRSGEAAEEVALLARQLRTELADLDGAIAEVDRLAEVASGETLPELALAAAEVRRASAAITRVANNIEENPSVLTPRSPRPTVELRP